jgi:hypothetical protein
MSRSYPSSSTGETKASTNPSSTSKASWFALAILVLAAIPQATVIAATWNLICIGRKWSNRRLPRLPWQVPVLVEPRAGLRWHIPPPQRLLPPRFNRPSIACVRRRAQHLQGRARQHRLVQHLHAHLQWDGGEPTAAKWTLREYSGTWFPARRYSVKRC